MASRGADGDDSDDGVELSNPGPPPARKKKKLEPVLKKYKIFMFIKKWVIELSVVSRESAGLLLFL